MKNLNWSFILLWFAITSISVHLACNKSEAQKVKALAVVTCSDTSGNFIPTGSAFNLSNPNFIRAHFIKVCNEVIVTGRVSWSSVPNVGGTSVIAMNMPPLGTPVFDGSGYGFYTFAQQGIPSIVPFTNQFVATSAGTVQIILTPTRATSGALYYSYSYTVSN